MSINLLSLPSFTIGDISEFLDIKSLLEMREVCKSMKDQIDMLVATQETIIDIHLVKLSGKETLLIGFLFDDEIDGLLWKICVASLFTKFKLSMVNVNISNGKKMHIELQADIMTNFLDLLKPLVERVEFYELKIEGNCSEIIRFFSNFLAGRTVTSVEFVQEYVADIVESREIDMELLPRCVDFIRKVNPRDVSISFLTLIEDTLPFLLELAEIVEEIDFERKMRTSTLKNVPVSVTQSMLTKKCEHLTFSGCVYSKAEVEQLLQFLNHIEKKVTFDADTEEEGLIVQIGEYSVKMDNYMHELAIKHLDLE